MRVLFPILIALTLSVGLTSQEAFAGVPQFCDPVQDGNWEDASTWNCAGQPAPPGSSASVDIERGFTVTINTDVTTDIVEVYSGPLSTLIIKNGASLTARTLDNTGDVFNYGTLTVNIFRNHIFDTFFNQCTGVVNILNGLNDPEFLVINHGIFNIESEFINKGIFRNSGTINGVITNQGDGVVVPINSICVVGGTFVPIDTTSLLLVGAQSTTAWMIPVIVAGIGFAIIIARKF